VLPVDVMQHAMEAVMLDAKTVFPDVFLLQKFYDLWSDDLSILFTCENFVIAGGATAYALVGDPVDDVDVFVLNSSKYELLSYVNRLAKCANKAGGVVRWRSTNSTITLEWKLNEQTRKLQFILTDKKTPEAVVFDFDLIHTIAFYHPTTGRFRVHVAALEALQTRKTYFCPLRLKSQTRRDKAIAKGFFVAENEVECDTEQYVIDDRSWGVWNVENPIEAQLKPFGGINGIVGLHNITYNERLGNNVGKLTGLVTIHGIWGFQIGTQEQPMVYLEYTDSHTKHFSHVTGPVGTSIHGVKVITTPLQQDCNLSFGPELATFYDVTFEAKKFIKYKFDVEHGRRFVLTAISAKPSDHTSELEILYRIPYANENSYTNPGTKGRPPWLFVDPSIYLRWISFLQCPDLLLSATGNNIGHRHRLPWEIRVWSNNENHLKRLRMLFNDELLIPDKDQQVHLGITPPQQFYAQLDTYEGVAILKQASSTICLAWDTNAILCTVKVVEIYHDGMPYVLLAETFVDFVEFQSGRDIKG
jgi:hypothetical protein